MRIALFALLILLSACVPKKILTKDMGNANIFVLSPLAVSTEENHNLGAISIALPKASPGLDTSRIAVFRSNMVLDYYAEAKWAADLPLVVQKTLQESFENARLFSLVTDDLSALETQYELQIDIRDFHIQLGTSNQAIVKLAYRLLEKKTQTVTIAGVVSQALPVEDNGLQAHLTQLNTVFATVQEIMLKAVTDSLSP